MDQSNTAYIPLKLLAAAWAQDAGTPPQMMLRRLGDWAVADVFPPGAFVLPSGEAIDTFELFVEIRATSGGIAEPVCIAGTTIFPTDKQLVELALVAATAVIALCKSLDVRPPLALWRPPRARWWRRVRHAAHIAPPPCPESDRHAAAINNRRMAEGSLGWLRQTLQQLRNPPRSHLRDVLDERTDEVDLQFWSAKWRREVERARPVIAECHDDALDQELVRLEAQRERFVGDIARREQDRVHASEGVAEQSSKTSDRKGEADTDLVHMADAAGKRDADRPSTASRPQMRELSEESGLDDAQSDARPASIKPWLIVNVPNQLLVIDEQEIRLPDRPFKLITMLAEAATGPARFVSNRDIEASIWAVPPVSTTAVADVVRDLRRRLRQHSCKLDGLIENRTNLGYALVLAPQLIVIER